MSNRNDFVLLIYLEFEISDCRKSSNKELNEIILIIQISNRHIGSAVFHFTKNNINLEINEFKKAIYSFLKRILQELKIQNFVLVKQFHNSTPHNLKKEESSGLCSY